MSIQKFKVLWCNKQKSNLKDETKSISIVDYVELKSEMYSFMKKDYKGGKGAKGINKDVVKKNWSVKNI